MQNPLSVFSVRSTSHKKVVRVRVQEPKIKRLEPLSLHSNPSATAPKTYLIEIRQESECSTAIVLFRLWISKKKLGLRYLFYAQGIDTRG